MAVPALISIVTLLLFFNICTRDAYADYGGWQDAHATFYGGGDASGTMGKLKKTNKPIPSPKKGEGGNSA